MAKPSRLPWGPDDFVIDRRNDDVSRSRRSKSASSKQILHTEQNVNVGSQRQWTGISYYGKLHAALGDKSRMGGVLKTWREIVFGGFAARHRHSIKSTRASMNKRRFQDQKQFAAGFVILAR